MPDVTVRPVFADGVGWEPTGGDAAFVLGDDNDATYVTSSGGKQVFAVVPDLAGSAASIPAGAKLDRIRVRARHSASTIAINTSTTEVGGAATGLITSGTATGDPVDWESSWQLLYGTATDPATSENDWVFWFRDIGSGQDVPPRLYEVWADFRWVEQPTVDFFEVDGAVSDVVASSRPTFVWTASSERQIVAEQIQIVETVGGAGVAAAPAINQARNGEWQVDVDLPDGAYTALLRVRHDFQVDHWSEWAIIDFEVDTSPPGKPTVAASVDPASGSVLLTVTDAETVDQEGETATIERQDPDGTWHTVADAIEFGDSYPTVDIIDRYPPLGVEVVYRARARRVVVGEPFVSVWSDDEPVTAAVDSWYVALPAGQDITRDGPVAVSSEPDVRPRPAGVFQPLPSGDGTWNRQIVTVGQPAGLDGTITFTVKGDAQLQRLEGILRATGPVCVRDPHGRVWWCAWVGWNPRRARGARLWWVDVQTVEVDAPAVVITS